jgi:hypothetical protein
MSTPTGPGPDDVPRDARGPDYQRGGEVDPSDTPFRDDRTGDPDGTVRDVGAPGVTHRTVGDPHDRQVEPVFVDSDRTTTGNRADRGVEPPVPVQDDAARRETVRREHVRRDTVRDDTVPDDTVRHDIVREEVVGPDPDRLLAADRQTVFAREREAFGGMKLGSAFFGWLTATGLAVLLLSLLTAAGVAFGVTSTQNVDKAVQASQNATGTAKTVGLISGIVLLVILFLAYYCGGYVAGRMARFNGIKQGLAVWLWFIVISAIIAAIAAIAGSKYNVLSQLNLPRIPVDEGSVTTAGIIVIVAAILAALLGALLGGAVGTRYHRRVDAAGFETQ